MQKMMGFVAALCVLNVVAALGLVGFLFATGRMDGTKVKVVADLARHHGTPEKLREKVGEILEVSGPATTSAPASQKGEHTAGAPAGDGHTVYAAEERVNYARQAMEQERLRLEAFAQDLQHRQESLEVRWAELKAAKENFDSEKKAFEPKVTGADDKVKAENFQKMLSLYDELKTKQVKDLFIDSHNEEVAASYLVAMEASRAAKIIGEFKTEEERKFIDRVLERIRVAGTSSASAVRTGGDVAAVPTRP